MRRDRVARIRTDTLYIKHAVTCAHVHAHATIHKQLRSDCTMLYINMHPISNTRLNTLTGAHTHMHTIF